MSSTYFEPEGSSWRRQDEPSGSKHVEDKKLKIKILI